MPINSQNMRFSLLQFSIWTAILLNVAPFAYGQAALKKGERLPNMTIKNLYNDTKKEINLSDLNSKLILFDFWSPSCGACLVSFPKLDSLQRLFGDEIRIILVNKQSLDSTKKFFEARKFLYKPDLPFATNDTSLNRLFPNLGNPAFAWLDGDGIFYETSEELTGDAIRNFLSQRKTGMENYRQKRRNLSSLFDPAFGNNLLSYSYLVKAIPSVRLSGAVGERGISSSNSTILDLYRKAYNEQGRFNFDKSWKIKLIVQDSSRYLIPNNSDLAYRWRKENLYTYSLLLPKEKAKDRFVTMQKDLDRYFGVDSKVEKQMAKCMVLVRTSLKNKLKSNKNLKAEETGPLKFTMSSTNTVKIERKRELSNQPYQLFSGLFGAWVELRLHKPFIDATGYEGNIDISLNGEILDRFELNEIRKALHVYDLDLVEKECFIDVLVLRDEI